MEEPPNDYKMTVYLFGKADSPCIAAWALRRKSVIKNYSLREICVRFSLITSMWTIARC